MSRKSGIGNALKSSRNKQNQGDSQKYKWRTSRVYRGKGEEKW
jgi:hypothetical protein